VLWEARIEANTWKLYTYWFFHNLILAYVIERLYWQDRGMTVQMVVYTETIYAAIVILLEIPTGVLADRWSRKNLLVIGALLACTEFAILIYARSFWHFALAVAFAAVQRALCSGTSNALLYDSLKTVDEEAGFERSLGRLRVFDHGASVLAALLGSLVAARAGLETTYWLSLGSLVVSLVVSFLLIEPPRDCGIDIEPASRQDLSFKAYVQEASQFFRQGPVVRYVLLAGVVVAATITYIDEFWQLYADAVAVPVVCFGMIQSSGLLVATATSAVAYKARFWLNLQQVIAITLTLVTIGTLMMSFTVSPGGLLLLIPLYAAAALTEPLIMGYLHHRADSFNRATIESSLSAVNRLATIAVGLVFGWVSTGWTIFAGFRLLGAFTGSYLLYYFLSMSLSTEESAEKKPI